MAFDSKALILTQAKVRQADQWEYGTSFQVKYFVISAGGHDPTDPKTALAPDASAVSIPGLTLFGPKPISSVTRESAICPTFNCTLDQGEYSGELSSIGLIAEVVYIGPEHPTPPLIGDQFLFALNNRPRLNIAATDGPINFPITPFL